MITWLCRYQKGYLYILIQGFASERFFNLCSANQITIWDLQAQREGYLGYISIKDYRRIQPLVRKSKVRLQILEKFGLPFFLYQNRKRKWYAAGLCTFFILLYLFSLFIWDITFEGNQMYTYDMLMTFFESQEIRYGMPKSRVSCEELEGAIRNEFSEITWVSARVSGTRLLVKIKENEVLSAIPKKDEAPCDLVASKDGIITEMVVRRGIPLVSVGDEVKAGQILVSGSLSITNDSNEVVTTHLIHSDADIEARTQYRYQKEIPLLHEVIVETGKQKRGYYWKAFRYSMLVMLPKKEQSNWNFIMEETQVKLFENFYLPIYWGKIKGKEWVSYERFYTEDEKKEVAEKLYQEIIENLVQKGVQIIENNVKILNSGFMFCVEVHVMTEEPIGRIQSIAKPEETIEPNERNGNDN